VVSLSIALRKIRVFVEPINGHSLSTSYKCSIGELGRIHKFFHSKIWFVIDFCNKNILIRIDFILNLKPALHPMLLPACFFLA